MKKLLLLLVFFMIPFSTLVLADESVTVEMVWELRGDVLPDGALLRLRKNHVELHAGQVSNHNIIGIGGYIEKRGANLSIGCALVDNKLGGFTRFGLKIDNNLVDVEGALHVYSQGLILGSTALRFNDKKEKRNDIRDNAVDNSHDDESDIDDTDSDDNGGGSDDNGDSETQPGSGDHDRGHGNDEGHWDSDNPGRGHGDDQVVGGGRNH